MATRFYFPSSGILSTIAPPYGSIWEQTSAAARLGMSRLPHGTAFTDASTVTGATGLRDMLNRQWISSESLAAGQISGTFSFVARMAQNSTSADSWAQVRISVVSEDGTVERGVLYAGQTQSVQSSVSTDPNFEFVAGTATTRYLSNVTLTPVTAQAGDRIVVEVGARGVPQSSGYNVFMRTGDVLTGTDHALGQGVTTDLRPWIEFSQNLFPAPLSMSPTVTQRKSSAGTTLTLTTTPTTGQKIVLKVTSPRVPTRNVTAVVGYGATWTKLYGNTGDRTSWWIGTASGASNAISVTFDGAHAGQHLEATVLTGLNSEAVVGTFIEAANSTALTTSSLSAGPGQIVLASAVSLNTTLTYDSVPLPAWDGFIETAGGGANQTSTLRRIPSTLESHNLHIDAPSASTALAASMIVLGTYIPPPTASFTATPPSGPAPLGVSFTDTSTGSPTSWSWTFDNGDTSTLQNPVTVYEQPGVYTVTLVATNPSGPSAPVTQTITVTESQPLGETPFQEPEVQPPPPVVYVRRRGWRYFATRLNGNGTETLLDMELPLEDVTIDDVLSGDQSLSCQIEPAYARLIGSDGFPIMQEWSTAIYAENDGDIRFGGILTNSSLDGPRWSLEAVGFTGYLRDLPYTGSGYKGIQVDPIDVVRTIWSYAQAQPGGNLAMVVDTATTGGQVKIGTELKQVEFDTVSGPVSFESGPYKLNWYTTHDLASNIDDLASETPFDYHERHKWVGQTIQHYLNIGYPKIGRRREDVRFVYGVNIFDSVELDRDGSLYASGTMVLGAGEGAAMIKSVSEPPTRPGGRLRRIAVVIDDSIKSKTRAEKRARLENQWRARIDDIRSVVVQDHPNARLGAVQVGDEIRLEGRGDWQDIDMWVRVLAIAYQTASGNTAEYTIARTDKLMQ